VDLDKKKIYKKKKGGVPDNKAAGERSSKALEKNKGVSFAGIFVKGVEEERKKEGGSGGRFFSAVWGLSDLNMDT